MKASLSYIHFRVHWQVVGLDGSSQRFDRDGFHRFFERLNSSPDVGGYDDFSYRPDRCELAKARGTTHQGGQTFSKVLYKDGVLSLVEEFTTYSREEFARKAKVVLDAWFHPECFQNTAILVQDCCVRGLVTPRHFDDSRAFLSGTVLKLDDGFGSRLSGTPQSVGFHFTSSREHQGVSMRLEAKVSSWRDGRSIWIEVNGTAPMPKPLNAARHQQAEAVFGRCTEFLESEIIPLLTDYDRADSQDALGA